MYNATDYDTQRYKTVGYYMTLDTYNLDKKFTSSPDW